MREVSRERRLLRRSSLPDTHIFVLTFLAEGKSLAVVGDRAGNVYVWDFASGAKAPPFERPERQKVDGRVPEAGMYRCFAVSSDGKLLAGGQYQSDRPTPKIVLWKAAAG